MKSTFQKIFLALLFVSLCVSANAFEITSAGRQFRSDISRFLSQEGFSPTVDEDESLCFKSEGVSYWIDIYGDGPFYVEFHRVGLGIEDANRYAVLKAVNKVNSEKRAVKCCMMTSTVAFTIESYCHVSEDFKYVVYKYIELLQLGYEEVKKAYNEYEDETPEASSTPFTVTSVLLGITDNSSNILTSYGNTLYSSQTKYIKPKLYLNVQRAGTYDIYVKFYNANGVLTTSSNSPSGYSYKSSITVTTSTSYHTLSGWGSDTYGHWSAGDYRMEFYYQGTKIYTKYFTVY